MKKPRIFMTAEEKYEETKNKVQELTEELSSIASKFGNSIVSMEDDYKKIYQKAKDAAKLGESTIVKNTIKNAARFKCCCDMMKDVQKRLEHCESTLQTLDGVSLQKMKTIEKALYAFCTPSDNQRSIFLLIKSIDKLLCDLETVLEIDTEAQRDRSVWSEDYHSTIVEEINNRLIAEVTMNTPLNNNSLNNSGDFDNEEKKRSEDTKKILEISQSITDDFDEIAAIFSKKCENVDRICGQMENASEEAFQKAKEVMLKGDKKNAYEYLECAAVAKITELKLATFKIVLETSILKFKIGKYIAYTSDNDFRKKIREIFKKVSDCVMDGDKISENTVDELIDSASELEKNEGTDEFRKYTDIIREEKFRNAVLNNFKHRLICDLKKSKTDDLENSDNSDED